MLIRDKDILDINNALAEIAPYTEEDITYQAYNSTTPGNPVAGTAATNNYNPEAISAGIRELTLEEIVVSGGAYETGDVEFSIRRATKPDYLDRIDYDGGRYRPKKITIPPLKGVCLWTVVARKE
jgi:hypothetical protein